MIIYAEYRFGVLANFSKNFTFPYIAGSSHIDDFQILKLDVDLCKDDFFIAAYIDKSKIIKEYDLKSLISIK